MKPTFSSSVLVLVLSIAATAILSGADAPPKSKTLVDFTHEDHERNGPEMVAIHRYDYAWGTWDKVSFLGGKGLLIPAVSGEGVIGANNRLVFGTATHVEIELAIGNRNEADAVTFGLVDADGTQVSWNMPLAGQPRGQKLTFRLALDQPERTESAGSKPGLDRAKLKKWELTGNWQPPQVEVVFVRIGAVALAPAASAATPLPPPVP